MLRIAALCVAAIAAGTAWCEDVLWRNMIGSLPYLPPNQQNTTSD